MLCLQGKNAQKKVPKSWWGSREIKVNLMCWQFMPSAKHSKCLWPCPSAEEQQQKTLLRTRRDIQRERQKRLVWLVGIRNSSWTWSFFCSRKFIKNMQSCCIRYIPVAMKNLVLSRVYNNVVLWNLCKASQVSKLQDAPICYFWTCFHFWCN